MRCWSDSHNLRKPHFKSILEGRSSRSMNPNVPSQIVTVFGNPLLQNSITTFNFSAGHPETTLQIYKIDFLNPDHVPGSGTKYTLNFLSTTGSSIIEPIAQFCAPSESISTTSIFPASCVFNNLGGIIQIDIARSYMSDLREFDDCWNIIFHYKAFKN
jgi:hypothetical protein